MNGIFFIFAGYLVLKEFEQIFTNNYLKYVKSEGRIKNYINQKIEKEKKAKNYWRIIKIGIHHSSMAKRRLAKNNPMNIKINTD